MSRRFKIERDCYEDENYLYKKGHVTERQSWMLPDLSVQMKTTNAPQLKIN